MNTQVPQGLSDDLDRVFKINDDIASQQYELDIENGVDTDDDTVVDQQQQPPSGEQNTQDDAGDEADPLDGLPPAYDSRPPRDAEGRIIGSDGKPIASTRQEKRDLFTYNKLRGVADNLRRQNETMTRELGQLRSLQQMPTQLGLNMDQVTEAMQFRARIESHPIDAVREIVARVIGNGYTMDQLFGPDAPAAINASIINQALDQRLRPLTSRIAAEEREATVSRGAEEDFNTFVADHEYADVHGHEIVHLVQRDGVSPERAYYELRLAAERNGLDFSQPLIPQFAAKQGDQQGQQPARGGQQQQRQQTRSLPGARSPAAGAPSAPASNFTVRPDTSFKDIVANAFKTVAASSRNP
jgi:hypothetical protein